MLMAGFVRIGWVDIFNELRMTGKIIFFLFFVLVSICFIPLAIIELIVIDSWIILFEYFKKDSDVIGMIEYLLCLD